MRARQPVFMILLINLIPIWGILRWGWTPFYVFYLFWLETLIISVFNTLKIIGCRGDEYDQKLHTSTHSYAGLHVNHWSHIGKAFRYFFIRLFIFLFYLLFIVIFIGFFASQKSGAASVLEVLIFRNTQFNYTLLVFILNQAGQFVFDFYGNGNYKKTHPSDFAAIFDGRQLIIHIAVVLGAVLADQKKFFSISLHDSYVPVIVVSIFCLVKGTFDLIIYYLQKDSLDRRELPSTAIELKKK